MLEGVRSSEMHVVERFLYNKKEFEIYSEAYRKAAKIGAIYVLSLVSAEKWTPERCHGGVSHRR